MIEIVFSYGTYGETIPRAPAFIYNFLIVNKLNFAGLK